MRTHTCIIAFALVKAFYKAIENARSDPAILSLLQIYRAVELIADPRKCMFALRCYSPHRIPCWRILCFARTLARLINSVLECRFCFVGALGSNWSSNLNDDNLLERFKVDAAINFCLKFEVRFYTLSKAWYLYKSIIDFIYI